MGSLCLSQKRQLKRMAAKRPASPGLTKHVSSCPHRPLPPRIRRPQRGRGASLSPSPGNPWGLANMGQPCVSLPHLLEDIAPTGAPAHDGVGGRLPIDVGLRVDGEDPLPVHAQQLLLHQAGLGRQGLIIPREASHLGQRVSRAGLAITPGTLGTLPLAGSTCASISPSRCPRWGLPSSPSPLRRCPTQTEMGGLGGDGQGETGQGV